MRILLEKVMRYSFMIVLILLVSSCSTKKIKNITYETSVQGKPLQLNIFVPRKAKEDKMPILLYVHGGNWNSGNRNLYGFFGRNFAKKQVVTVLPSYTLSPEANYDQMATEIAAAIEWVVANADQYKGDAKKIFVTGHSAGGHLVALATMNPRYGIQPNTVAGIILNDAAGLDMKHYLEQNAPTQENNYIKTWTSDPNEWERASPIYYLNKNTPPFLIYVGSKTYPSIKVANDRFVKELHLYQKEVTPIILDKKHVPMILQYFWPWNDQIDETVEFMKKAVE